LDVDVLSEIVKKFRDTHLNFGNIPSDTPTWTPTSIDPFNYSTQSQVAIKFFCLVKRRVQRLQYQQSSIVQILVRLVLLG